MAWVLPHYRPMIAQDHAAVTFASLRNAVDQGSGVWDDLMRRAGCASPFMSWAWHRAWLDAAPPEEAAAAEVLALHDVDGSLQGLLPIQRCRMRFRRLTVRALTWAIGDIGCPDELDVPVLSDADASALTSAIDALPWDIIVLPNLTADAVNARRLAAALVERGHGMRMEPLWSCPQLELPAHWDDYLSQLSANRRQILRRKERSLFRAHSVALVHHDERTLNDGWQHLLELHGSRWSGAGAFQDPRTVTLQRQFAGEMERQQRLWLTTLTLDGQPAAAWYGFVSGDTVYFYQGGRDPRWERESVGLVLMSLMIQRAIAQGYRKFNFLRGDDEYKRAWTSAPRTTEELVVFRAGCKGGALRVLDTVAAFRGRAAQ